MLSPAPQAARPANAPSSTPAHRVWPAPAQAGGDPLADRTIASLLQLLNEHLGIHAVFVAPRAEASRNAAGWQVRAPSATDASAGGGRGMGVPIRRADGRLYGMLCCFDADRGTARDWQRLLMSARLAARMIDGGDAPPDAG